MLRTEAILSNSAFVGLSRVVAAMALPVALVAQTAPDLEQVGAASVEAPEPVDAREAFVATLDSARSDRVGAIADAQATFDRTVATLESATASLTPSARRRIEEGPLTDARRQRDDSVRAAELEFDVAVREAVEGVGAAAVAVYAAADETILAVRSEHELYAAVVAAAEAALESEVEYSRATRASGQGADAELKAAETAVAEARRIFEVAASERNAARRARPADPKPDYANNILGGLAAGLSQAAGDYERASAIGGQLDRETSDRLGEHAASVERYESRLAEAEEIVTVADEALGAAIRRFNLASVRFRSTREAGSAADSDYQTAYEARIAAGIDAARITRVHGLDELEAVTESIREGALSAIAGIEEVALAALTQATAVEVFQSAVAEYAQPKAGAIEAALEEIEAESRDSLQAAEREYDAAVASASSAVRKFKQALAAHAEEYQGAVRAADKDLEDALVRFYSRIDTRRSNSKYVYALEEAESDHEGALESAAQVRLRRSSDEVSGSRTALSEIGARCAFSWAPPVRFDEAEAVVSALRTYKANRARADAGLGNCVGNAYMRFAKAAAQEALDAAQKRAETARASARSVVIARNIDADRSQADRLRKLEAAVSAGLLASGRGTQQ